MSLIRIGTRGSRLALVQTGQVIDILKKSHPGYDFEMVVIKTTGDKILDSPLSKIGDKGLFTKEIENELISGKIDMAVHSMKDMPVQLPSGLMIGAVTERLNPLDVLISKKKIKIDDLNETMTIATGSLRRKAQLLASFPDLKIIEIRGNVETRLKKMNENPDIDGIILAAAGLERLGLNDKITETVPADVILPAAGQASLAIEIRENDLQIENIVAVLNHRDSRIAVECERSFLSELGGGCQVPIGALAEVSGDTVILQGMVANLDGSIIYRWKTEGEISDHINIGQSLALEMLEDGADDIIKAISS
jgi:hydroxymethylbilane synthase